MKRDPDQLTGKTFDLLVIGGGISGACVAHDAALRGLSVALVEMKDFGWATSAATSKLIHGGLRYLKNLEFELVRESLKERRYLERIAPHMVYPMPFLVPTYKHSLNHRAVIFPAMLMYDVLSFDKGSLKDPSRKVPSFEFLSKDQVVQREPNVNDEELTGGAIYYDCQMFSAERLTLEFVLGAANNGATVANYIKVEKLILENGAVVGAKVKDELGGKKFDIRAKVTANVAGPWADFVSGLLGEKAGKKLVRSEGIHIVTRALVDEHALVYRTESGRHFFMIPWRGKTLIGTTDDKYEGSPDDYGVSNESVLRFIEEINQAHPSAQLTLDDVEFSYGGLRPIVEDETEVDVDVYDQSRKYEIFDHAGVDRIENFFTVVGGKYTTSRNLAEQLVDQVYGKLKKNPTTSTTKHTPLPGGKIERWTDFMESAVKASNLDREVAEAVAQTYGSESGKIFGLVKGEKKLGGKASAKGFEILAQIAHGVDEEMAVTLEDAIFRRTSLSLLGLMKKNELKKCAGIMKDRLGWDDATTEEQVESIWRVIKAKGIKY
jgi:glycerol-3-phosphate dehydrogenase